MDVQGARGSRHVHVGLPERLQRLSHHRQRVAAVEVDLPSLCRQHGAHRARRSEQQALDDGQLGKGDHGAFRRSAGERQRGLVEPARYAGEAGRGGCSGRRGAASPPRAARRAPGRSRSRTEAPSSTGATATTAPVRTATSGAALPVGSAREIACEAVSSASLCGLAGGGDPAERPPPAARPSRGRGRRGATAATSLSGSPRRSISSRSRAAWSLTARRRDSSRTYVSAACVVRSSESSDVRRASSSAASRENPSATPSATHSSQKAVSPTR